jgi:hypothetical protein
MADKKISALTSATTPLAGTEVLPIVQSGATVKVAVSDLTAGRAVSALSVASATIGAGSGAALSLQSNATTQATIGTNGTFAIGTTDTTTYAPSLQLFKSSGNPLIIGGLAGQGISMFSNTCDANGYNAANCAIGMGYTTSTGRSINAGGTINAVGLDYAEYMTKAGDFTVAKGDVVGIDAQGKLTNVFADAVSFVVKSTDPSYVGGDTWGSVDQIGLRPNEESTQAEKDAYEATLEAARQTVDRIAFAGQVPVNVTGATAGQYIIPVNDNGAIKGQAVSNPTFEQYQSAVGKVIAIEADGRAKIIVKVA